MFVSQFDHLLLLLCTAAVLPVGELIAHNRCSLFHRNAGDVEARLGCSLSIEAEHSDNQQPRTSTHVKGNNFISWGQL